MNQNAREDEDNQLARDGVYQGSWIKRMSTLVFGSLAVLAIGASVVVTSKASARVNPDGDKPGGVTSSRGVAEPSPSKPAEQESHAETVTEQQANEILRSGPTRPAISGEFVVYEGDGSQTIAIEKIDDPDAIGYFTYEATTAGGGFSVAGVDSRGRITDLNLVVDGQPGVTKVTGSNLIDAFGAYSPTEYLDIISDGHWEIRLYSYDSIPSLTSGAAIGGNGSEVFTYEGSELSATITYSGVDRGDFGVFAWPMGEGYAGEIYWAEGITANDDVVLEMPSDESLVMVDSRDYTWRITVK